MLQEKMHTTQTVHKEVSQGSQRVAIQHIGSVGSDFGEGEKMTMHRVTIKK